MNASSVPVQESIRRELADCTFGHRRQKFSYCIETGSI